MLWICGLLPRRQMALGISAVRGCDLQTVVAAYVTIRTGNIGVPIGKRKTDRRRGVVYGGAEPTVKRVAGFAGLRELSCDVIGIGSFLKISLVAGDAGRRQSLELAHCRALVAVFALHRRVCPKQREAILVVLYLLHRYVPALHRVALCAVRAHLSLVHVGVAVFAILSHVRENRLHVALRALHFFVHAAQGILGLVMVELRNRADGAPGGGRMAIFAGDRQGAVRTPSALPLRRLRWSVGWLPRKEQEPAQNLNKRLRNCPLDLSYLPSVSEDWFLPPKTNGR
jgi:hypothetical protein